MTDRSQSGVLSSEPKGDMFGPLKPGQCPGKKMGEYNPLRCAAAEGHAGDHCYYVSGQYPKDARK